MRILNIAGMSLIALTHLLFLCFIVQEFCRTLRGKKHRADAPVFEGFDAAEEDEPYIPKLSADALQKLKPGREACFVEQEIFPAVPRVLSFMTMEERGWARMALSAFIGFILEISVEQEKDFTTVLALLENAAVPEAADEGWKSVADLVMEDHKGLSCYSIFAFFREHCPDRQRIYSLCVQIVKTLCVNLYGFVPLAFTGNPLRTVVKGESEA